MKNVLLFFKGMAMGAADLVPGVSGGTIAFITGIYEELIATIKSFNLKAIKILFKNGIRAFWSHINGTFLLFLLLGIATSIISLAKLISYLLTHHEKWVFAFFFGLVLASFFYLLKQVKKWNVLTVVSLVVATVFSFWITLLEPGSGADNLTYIFISGAIAICAMILPGISGSFILLLLGSYELVLNAVKSFDLTKIAVFAVGCVVGLLSFSHVLNYLFKHYKNVIMAVLTGFLLGALNKLWPWKEVVSTRLNSKGQEVPLMQNNILPDQISEVWPAVGLALIGFVLILMMEKMDKTNKKAV